MSSEDDLALSGGGDLGRELSSSSKRQRFDKCFSFMEITIEPGKSLKELDTDKLKTEIKKWAKAVVRYARQVSGHLGGSRD